MPDARKEHTEHRAGSASQSLLFELLFSRFFLVIVALLHGPDDEITYTAEPDFDLWYHRPVRAITMPTKTDIDSLRRIAGPDSMPKVLGPLRGPGSRDQEGSTSRAHPKHPSWDGCGQGCPANRSLIFVLVSDTWKSIPALSMKARVFCVRENLPPCTHDCISVVPRSV